MCLWSRRYTNRIVNATCTRKSIEEPINVHVPTSATADVNAQFAVNLLEHWWSRKEAEMEWEVLSLLQQSFWLDGVIYGERGEDFRPRSSRMSVCALRAVRRSTLFAGGEIARRDSVEFQARVFLYTGGVFYTKQLPFPLWIRVKRE
jgi:hypothetical protein